MEGVGHNTSDNYAHLKNRERERDSERVQCGAKEINFWISESILNNSSSSPIAT